MTTIGYLCILIAGLIIRAVYKGRVLEIGQDLTDAYTAVVSGDSAALTAVLARTGTTTQDGVSNFVSATLVGASEAATITNNTLHTLIGKSALALGSAAKGYRFAATGPDYYDCSGLMWKACEQAGVYKGSRFTTFTIGSNKQFVKVTGTPLIDDIVVWPTHHMGVMTGPDQLYSARSVASGIGYGKISADTAIFGKQPVYYRPVSVTASQGKATA